MEVAVLNETLDVIYIVDTYDSFIWTDRYCATGDFEFYSSMRDDVVKYLKADYYLQSQDSEHLMIIEKTLIKSDVENGNTITITGRSLESILERRIIWKQKTLSGNLQNGIEELLNECIINPTDSDRKIDNFLFEASTDELITPLTIEAQYTGDNLYEVIRQICEEKNIGFKITMHPASRNILSYSSSFWEPGGYSDVTGAKVGFSTRVRTKNLIPVEQNTKYCFNTNSTTFKYAVRSYDQNGTFVANWGDLSTNAIRKTNSNEHYISITIHEATNGVPSETIMGDIENGTIKPFCGLAIGNHIQTDAESNSKFFKFMLYAGVDRSYDQTKVPYVIFSPDFDNMLNSNYVESKASLKNVTLVGGEGEGSLRKYATVGEASGLNRRELFTDAKDISSDVGNHKILNAEEYAAVLKQRGNETLSENSEITSFEGEIETTQMFKYRTDFFNGDIVQLANEYGNESRVRIVEMVMTSDETGNSVYPTYKTVK